jgi:hypothetical protein
MRVAVSQDAFMPEPAGEVNLHDAVQRHLGEELRGIEVVVDGVGVDIRDVQEDTAAGRADQPVEELGLRHVRSRHLEHVRHVLQHQWLSQRVLYGVHAVNRSAQHLGAEPHRCEQADVDARGTGHAEMVAVVGRAGYVADAFDLVEVVRINRAGSANRQPEPVRDNREGIDNLAEFVEGRRTAGELFGDDLHEIDLVPGSEGRRRQLRPET